MRARELKLTPDEQLLFTLISRAPMKKNDFKRETKMESKQIDSILKELLQRKLVKPIKRDGKKDNIWVRFDAAEEETGGKVDNNIVEVLKEAEGNIEVLRA